MTILADGEAGLVHRLFAAQARRTPEAVAVTAADGTRLTYGELDELANGLAADLVDVGIRPDALVAILQQRSLRLLVSILAVLKAGAGYLPLHHGSPARRMQEVIDQAGAGVLLVDRASANGERLSTGTVLTVDDHRRRLAEPPDVGGDPGQLAYVMFTSGSTGEPKGVAVAHREVAAFASDSMFDPQQHTRVLMAAPHAFDGSTYELWVPLLHGGELVLPPADDIDPRALSRQIVSASITGVLLTAGLFRVIAEESPECFADVREVMTGGDVISPAAVSRIQQFCPRTTVRATYGPTETTLFATQWPVPAGYVFGAGGVPMGRPLDDTRLSVLDADLRPVADAEPGELYVAGAGLARGYLGRPGLTAERFVADPYGRAGERVYRTGDLVRRHGEGMLEFIGRSDDQVKIRGHRVEPREIEHALGGFPGLAQVAVSAAPDPSGEEKQLIGYLVAGDDVDLHDIRAFAAQRLPVYMVPSAFVRLDALPLTGNGKIDYDVLPPPALAAAELGGRAPRTPREQVLCELFAEVLGVGAVTIDQSFFDLGGHSLLATRLASRMRRVLGMDLPIRHLLEHPTVAGLAGLLAAGDGESATGQVLNLRAAGNRMPLFCFHPGGGLAWCYSGLLRHVPKGHPVFGIQAQGLAGPETLPADMTEMADAHRDRIRTMYPHGPYALLGWSFGGLVAQAVAVRLREAGCEVPVLALLDAGREDASIERDPGPRAVLGQVFEGIDAFAQEPGDGPIPLGRVREILSERRSMLASLDEATIARLIEVTRNDLRLGDETTPARFDGDVLYFEATAERAGTPTGTADFWAPYTGGRISRHVVGVLHEAMTSPAAFEVIGPVLAKALQECE